jgi:hypothetical protein
MELEVYSRRWGHSDTYQVSKTSKGWNVAHLAIGGACDKTGAPYLFDNLDHDSINYPQALGEYMEWLWEQATSGNMSEEQLKQNLDMIGKWIQATEQSSPGGIFVEFK